MSGFGIRTAFNIGKKTLRSQLAGLNVTSNNIANVNTEGYSRQEITLKADDPLISPDGVFGNGVSLMGIRRIRDQLVDRQVRIELQSRGYNESLERILRQVETTINEPSETGIRSLMSDLFDNFAALANDPENTTTRFNLRENAKVLVEAFHGVDKQLQVLSDDVDFEIQRAVDTINSIAANIANLNSKILAAEGVSKGTANDLRDERDRNIDELSEMMDIYALEKDNGVIEVAGTDRSIITSNFPTELTTQITNPDGNLKTDVISVEDQDVVRVANGKLAALLKARNEIIPHYRDRFNDLAKSLIDSVNNIHNNGVGIQGDANAIPKDNDFFTGDTATNIEVATAILLDENAIAAAKRIDTVQENGSIVTSGSPGDNTIALEIAEIKTKRILNNGTQSLIDYLNSVVGEIGIETAEAHDNVLNHEKLINQFENIRDSTSGVSLDEEFVSLIKYQRGFQAGARVITTVSDMFETLINM